MARADPHPVDHNDPERLNAIRAHTDKFRSLRKQRDSVNADMNAERKAIKALNVDMDAWRASVRRAEMDPDVRDEFDRSQVLCNKALGVPIQADLFAPTGDGTAGEIPAGA